MENSRELMPYTTASDGARLHYEISGTGACDVMLLHGMGSSEIWTPVLPHLDSSKLRIVTCDFRGHGRSTGDSQNFTYPQLHQDILAVADAAQCARSVVVGFSGGCRNAVWLAAKSPDRVRGLVLVAPPGLGIVPLPPEAVTAFLDSLQQTGDLSDDFAPWFTEKIGRWRGNVVRPMAATPRAVLEASVRLWVETSIIDDITGLSVPIMVIAGAREPLYTPEFQRQTTLAVLPQATMTVVDTSHYSPCEAPAAVAALISRFALRLSANEPPS
jgi:pimeloyl-ACP methyl ester carboxylesterase